MRIMWNSLWYLIVEKIKISEDFYSPELLETQELQFYQLRKKNLMITFVWKSKWMNNTKN